MCAIPSSQTVWMSSNYALHVSWTVLPWMNITDWFRDTHTHARSACFFNNFFLWFFLITLNCNSLYCIHDFYPICYFLGLRVTEKTTNKRCIDHSPYAHKVKIWRKQVRRFSGDLFHVSPKTESLESWASALNCKYLFGSTRGEKWAGVLGSGDRAGTWSTLVCAVTMRWHWLQMKNEIKNESSRTKRKRRNYEL